MLFWRVPASTSHRFGGRYPTHPHGRHMRAVRTLHICRLNKQHMVSIAVGLAVITLLLVIFAYHGGNGIGSWFYSLLVVLSGLAFVVFGPLLLCRFLLHAYYRQLEARTMRSRVTAQTQTGESVAAAQAPHVYACIIVTQDNASACPHAPGSTRLSDLPTYEEAVAGLVGRTRPVQTTGQELPPGSVPSETAVSCETTVVEDLDKPDDTQPTANTKVESPESAGLDNEDSPPPTYVQALALMRALSVEQSAGSASGSAIRPTSDENVDKNNAEETDGNKDRSGTQEHVE